MRTSHWVVLALAGTVLIGAALAQIARDRTGDEVMREKLRESQALLQGLALEEYGALANHASRLRALTLEGGWRAFDNPLYEQQTVIFRRHVDALLKAAREENLDAATLAYVRMTMSCVDCHKLVRGKFVVEHRMPERLMGASTCCSAKSGKETATRLSAAN